MGVETAFIKASSKPAHGCNLLFPSGTFGPDELVACSSICKTLFSLRDRYVVQQLFSYNKYHTFYDFLPKYSISTDFQ